MTDSMRTYETTTDRGNTVQALYYTKNSKQTFEYAKSMLEKYGRFIGKKWTMLEALAYTDTIVDDSDPDTDASQLQHAMQTAEACRKAFPNQEWMHLMGLIHDVGKILVEKEMGGLEQWEVVGDTFPVGCAFSNDIVYYEAFAHNPDSSNPNYNTELGIYERNCGLKNLIMAWGHDEYMYMVLQNHPECKLPPEASPVIRLHSFYAWHSKGAYKQFMSEEDERVLPLVQAFQKCDLYSKIDQPLKWEGELKEYYTALIEKYTPGVIQW
jgi:inositol oxygenase